MASGTFTSVIIAAAGKSRRMTETKDKMLASLGGIPVIQRTIAAFEKAATADEIIIIASNGNIEKIKEIVKDSAFKKVKAIVSGGDTRSESVANGLKELSPACAYISIHDGARPFITPEEIDRLHTVAYGKDALFCGSVITDTVKRLDKDGAVAETIDRTGLVAAQTPQIFRRDIYENAVKAAGGSLCCYTDDCSVVEAAGGKVFFCECRNFNIKITTEADLRKGEFILKYRENYTL